MHMMQITQQLYNKREESPRKIAPRPIMSEFASGLHSPASFANGAFPIPFPRQQSLHSPISPNDQQVLLLKPMHPPMHPPIHQFQSLQVSSNYILFYLHFLRVMRVLSSKVCIKAMTLKKHKSHFENVEVENQKHQCSHTFYFPHRDCLQLTIT